MSKEGNNVASPRFGDVGHSLTGSAGPEFNLSVGYGLGNGLRAELEGFYSYNSLSNNNGAVGTTAGTKEQKFGPMVNVIYDIGAGLLPVVQPYVGAGVGYIWAQENNLHVGGAAFSAEVPRSTEGNLAYQGIVGVAYPITPALRLTADYRFLGLVNSRSYNGGLITEGGVTSPTRFKMFQDHNNLITVGFTYNFGAAPPPAPAPAPTPVAPSPISRSYLVFFDWDKATLTDRARQIVAEAAANSTKVQYTRIQVNGYTDTSGTPRYNQGLSVRRAQAVAAELVKDGVPMNAIAIQGFGETHLLVPTGPGVREPQNRRVEIIIL
jgi:outer membrane protein OmpA-like peptidoglycan-associated protein